MFALPYWVQPQTAIDDSFITSRHSRNLARGEGLLFNPGQKVLGTTTPLWAMGIVWIFHLPLSDEIQGYLVSLFGGILALLGIGLWSRARFPTSNFLAGALASTLILIPSTADAFLMGMETAPLIFFCTLFWIILSNDKNTIEKWFKIVVLAQIILLLRLDSVFFLGSFGLAYLVFSKTKNVRALFLSGLVVTILTLGWLVFCKTSYGHYFPHSMLAKSSFSSEFNLGPMEVLNAWIEKVCDLLRLNFPWPLNIKFFAAPLYGLSVFAAFALPLTRWRKLEQNQKAALFGAGIYLLSYSLFFTFGRAGIFPWYAHLPCFIFFGVTIPFLMERTPKASSIAVLSILLGGAVVMQALGVVGLSKLKNQNSPGLRLGQYLKSVNCQSVMLEPIGYIGFFSDCKHVYDLAGLVSPEILTLRRTAQPGWFFKAVEEFKPQYIVLRKGEVERNSGFNVGVLFSGEDEQAIFKKKYLPAGSFDESWEATYSLYKRFEN